MFHCPFHLCCCLLVCTAKLLNMIVIKIHSFCHIPNQRTQSHPNTPKIASVPPNLTILKDIRGCAIFDIVSYLGLLDG